MIKKTEDLNITGNLTKKRIQKNNISLDQTTLMDLKKIG
jgi:hypothetical protein